ncbi:RNA-binding signal recognition particle subunit srp14 [Schistosoma haematobium]|uniref:Signal recognition particle 14 kDa protein n=1 Tax=Schistosoma haematobium TaxID=6185 RepID=A0A922LRH6_SCHHA|nr:RNA-binding signal recognition particle subunit srp14 [Schistosoma haematobium]KAH9591989.1 RNA-binding signal recognition particle subunit srp14 [Schistosoma haematobium]
MYIERIFRRVVCGVFSNVCATLVRMLLDNDTFLTSLHKLFNQSKSSGSLYITMKRYDGRVKPIPKRVQKVKDVHVTNENSCLLRATLGNQKISTVVHQKDMNRFNQAYSNLLKANIDGLKKRDKRVKSTNISSKLNRPKTEKG